LDGNIKKIWIININFIMRGRGEQNGYTLYDYGVPVQAQALNSFKSSRTRNTTTSTRRPSLSTSRISSSSTSKTAWPAVDFKKFYAFGSRTTIPSVACRIFCVK
jgi:hypothetical protein